MGQTVMSLGYKSCSLYKEQGCWAHLGTPHALGESKDFWGNISRDPSTPPHPWGQTRHFTPTSQRGAWPLMACLAKVPGGKVAEHLTQCSSLLLHEGRPEAPPFPLSEGWPVAQACRAAEAGGGLSSSVCLPLPPLPPESEGVPGIELVFSPIMRKFSGSSLESGKRSPPGLLVCLFKSTLLRYNSDCK